MTRSQDEICPRGQPALGRGGLCVLVLVAAAVAGAQVDTGDAPLLEQAAAQGWVRKVIRPSYRDYHGIRERWAVSDLVVLGRVVDQAAQLSPDGRSVWTEYSIEVLTVFRQAGGAPASGRTVTARVEGGRLVASGRTISVVNAFFPPLLWVREHIFFLSRTSEDPETYSFLGGGQGVFRRDEDDKVRCHLPEPEWGFICRKRDGGPWVKLVKDMRKRY